jgi:hypothetical protein
MQINEFNNFKQLTEQFGVIFYYSGYFTQNVIAAMGDALKTKLEGEIASTPTIRKIFSTFVEMAQNIMHYSLSSDSDRLISGLNEHKTGAIAIGKNDDKYYILCGNFVNQLAVEALNNKLEEIHKMSKEEIKHAYKKQLQSESDANSNGAGLGFLTVARDSVEPIEYSFVELPNEQERRAFFYIKATII